MEFKVLDITYNMTPFKPVNGPATQIKGGPASATFECDCGHVWSAVASTNQMTNGYFYSNLSGVTAQCPACDKTSKVSHAELEKL